jgi:hypothetical protein
VKVFFYLKSDRQLVSIVTQRALRRWKTQRVEYHHVSKITHIVHSFLRIKRRRNEGWKYQNPIIAQQILIKDST